MRTCSSGVEATTVSQDDLIIPVYLNQRVVFDLVAVLRGGIASITQATQSHKDAGSAGAEVTSKFGLSNALSSLLKIDLAAKASGATSRESAETISESRVHTPASLFITLRAQLRKNSYIIADSRDMRPKTGSIIEFCASLRRNPLHEALGALVETTEMAQGLAGDTSKGKGSNLRQLKGQVASLLSSLTGGEGIDLTTGLLECGYRSVVALERQYLNDPSMSDLIDGTFRTVGKVIRVIGRDEGGISLNRKSALGRFPPSIMAQLEEAIEAMRGSGFVVPDTEWEVPGPVLQVLPIAIFA